LRRLFVRHGLVLAGAAVGLTRLSPSLFGINQVDPITYMVVPLVLVAARYLPVICLPAERRQWIPVETLRAE
jgi:hypothetical protein